METNGPASGVRPLPRIGQELGKFIIEREMPRGGQARVYRAWQVDLQRAVALKLLPGSITAGSGIDPDDAEALARFRREIENIAQVDHPNIVRVYEAGELEGFPYFSMEFIEGRDTESIVRSGPIPPDEAAAIMEAMARAIAEAHARGIVHRDIKPGNIIVRNGGGPVLTDFGLAQNLTRSEQLTQTGVSMGTPAYMAPEQARGERNRVGVRSDIYGLGATLFTLLTAKRPVEGESTYELMLKVAESTGPKWPRQAIEDVPPDLRAIVEMAMQPDPLKRYESAAAMADDIERYLRGDWVVARTRGKLSRAWLKTRRYVPVAAVVVLALGLAGGMIYTGLNPRDVVNRDGTLLDERRWFAGNETIAEDDDVEQLFGEDGTWTRLGAAVQRGAGGEIVLARTGTDPILISPRDPTCWGDFTLQSDLRVRDVEGPLVLRVGMPDDYSHTETAYSIVLGAGARDRYELQRLGVTVLSGYRQALRPLLEPDVWYRAQIRRRGQSLSFTMYERGQEVPFISFSFEDDFPALVSGRTGDASYGRQRFAVVADVSELRLRDVTVSHRDTVHSTEALLFSVGQYAEAELRTSARISYPLASDADAVARDERAGLYFLRARCREKLARPEDAYADLTQAKALVEDPALRTRIFMLSSRIETTRGDDASALAQLRVARISSGPLASLTSMLFHDAHARARALADDEPERAIRYYDFVADSALGSPGLVSDSLYHSALLRMELARQYPEQGPALVADARGMLERIDNSNYQRFGGVFVPAMAVLFELRHADPGTEPATLLHVARALAANADSYGAPRATVIAPMAHASWVARMNASGTDFGPAEEARAWLTVLEDSGADPVWVMLQRNLMAEERPELSGNSDVRVVLWRELAGALDLENPAHALPGAVAEYFIGSAMDAADASRREDLLRRAVRRDLPEVQAHWVGDMGADAFADYCIAMYEAVADQTRAVRLLHAAAGTDSAGALVHLQGRADRWLPLRR